MIEYPHSETAEKAVLGGLILDSRWYHEVSTVVSMDDFYLPVNRAIFSAIADLVKLKSPIDAVLIHGEMARADTSKLLKDVSYLAFLTDECIPSHCVMYAKEVHDLARRRAMIMAGIQVQHEGLAGRGTVDEYMASSRSVVVSIADEKTDTRALLVKDTISETISEATSGESGSRAVMTGLGVIDHYYGALYPRMLTILAARPGMGKSTFLLNVAANAALSGRHVFFLSLEDDRHFLQCRLLSRFADVDCMSIVRRRLSDEEKLKLQYKRDIVGSMPITIDDGGPFTSEQVVRRVNAHCAQHPCDLVIIDHLGHVSDTGKSQYEIATNAIKNLSDLPKQCNVPVLLASQLNREVEKRDSKEPTLSDLRNSGEIEQRARTVWFLYRPNAYNKDADQHELVFTVAKANHGITGKTSLWIDLPKMTIQDRTRGNSNDGY